MGLQLCDTCYNYERRNSQLVPISQRRKLKGTFIGVKKTASGKKYNSQIWYHNRMKYLGTYESEVKASQHYDFVCRIIGRTRRLNFPFTQTLPKFNIPAWIQSINICVFFSKS